MKVKRMNLHRVKDQNSDWEHLAPKDRNKWQRIAAKTKGVATVGNLITLAGNALVFKGLYDVERGKTVKGLGEIVVGRMCDLADGKAADMTGTKSPLGEAADAASDKVQALAASLMLKKCGIISRHIATTLLAPQAINVVATVAAKMRGREIHTSEVGKVGAGIAWGSIIGFVATEVSEMVDMPEPVTNMLERASKGALIASTALTASASTEYLQTAFGTSTTNLSPDHSLLPQAPSVPAAIIL